MRKVGKGSSLNLKPALHQDEIHPSRELEEADDGGREMNTETQGRLLLSSTFLICRDDAAVVANLIPMDVVGIPIHEAEADARRLVACWNACLGTSTEELEARTKEPS
jgi:hypothetical protein